MLTAGVLAGALALAMRRRWSPPAPFHSAATPLRMPLDEPRETQGRGVRGSLTDLTLATLLGVLEQEKRTGILSVWGPYASGTIVWRNGRLVVATYDMRRCERDAAAVRAMVGLHSGTFSFEPRDVPGDADLGVEVVSVLMDAAREADEANRDRH